MLSWSRLLVVVLISAGAVYFSFRLRSEPNTLMIAVWWYAAVFGYTLATLVSIPDAWWAVAKEWQGRLGYFLALAIATITWWSAGIASGEINASFEISATMLPFALTAYTFGIAVLFVAGIGAIFASIPLVILYTVSLLVEENGMRALKVIFLLVTVYLLAQLSFFFISQPVTSGYIGPVVERLALEFDFDEKVLCKNLSKQGKYLYLTANRDFVLQVIPLPDWSMTPRAMAESRARGESLSAIASKSVARCIFEDKKSGT